MKTTIIIIAVLIYSTKFFAFSGGHDSLLFDDSQVIEIPKNSDCKIRMLGWNNVTVTSYKIVQSTSCGMVFTEKKEEKHFVQDEMDVPVGSEISTSVSGHALIQLGDGSAILLKENTKIVIDESFCQKSRLIKLISGSIWQNIKNLVHGEPYEIATERHVAGVRGTQFEVVEENDKSIVRVFEGTVEVKPIMNDKTNKELIKAFEKLIEDMQSGAVSMEEYTEKTIRLNEIMQGSRQFPSVMVEAGNMVYITYEVSAPEPIPTDYIKWFEDQKFDK